jgi:AcrR family transcriptional regulator
VKIVRDRRDTRWDAHRATRRAQLVDAALLAIREHGAGVGMDDLAARAGTSKTVVYRHFADRGQLHLAVCARVAEVLTTQVRAATDQAEHPRDKVAAGIGAYLRLIEHDAEVYRFVVHRPLVGRTAAGSAAAQDDPMDDLATLIGDQAAALIAEQLRRTGKDTAAAKTWGHAIVGMVRGAGDNWLARPAGITREELTAQLTDLTWSGLSGVVAAPADRPATVAGSPAGTGGSPAESNGALEEEFS